MGTGRATSPPTASVGGAPRSCPAEARPVQADEWGGVSLVMERSRPEPGGIYRTGRVVSPNGGDVTCGPYAVMGGPRTTLGPRPVANVLQLCVAAKPRHANQVDSTCARICNFSGLPPRHGGCARRRPMAVVARAAAS